MITEQTETPSMDQIMEEWSRLKYAAELLEQVYIAVGPYPHKEKGALYGLDMSEEPWNKVRDFFQFDDSE
jgi:hypothetical protein